MSGRIFVVGIGSDGLAGLTSRARELLLNAQLILGSDAVLRLVAETPAEKSRIGADLNEVVELLRDQPPNRRVAIVAAGDPLFYGITRYLCERLGNDRFEVIPHVSCMQLAFARVKQSWEEALLGDLSTRKLDDLLNRIRTAETVGLFTSDDYPPSRVARELLANGIDYFRASVCENIAAPNERLTQCELAELAEMTFDPLNVLILQRKSGRPDQPRPINALMRFGNPDEVFAQSRPKTGLITQAEIRALALAQLDLQPGCVVWDVGAGSGSVAIEAAGLVAPGVVYAIEQDPADFQLIVANAEKFGVQNIKPVHGVAPAVFAGLPRPDAIFIGGDGKEVASMIESAYTALRDHGRLVVHVAVLEMLHAVYTQMKCLNAQLETLLIQYARGVEQLEMLRFESVNPSFLLKVRK